MLLGLLLDVSLLAVPDPHLHAAKVFYDEFQFARCLQQLSQAARSSTDETELAEIELYGGLCRYNLGDFAGADEHFRIALRLSPNLSLPAMTSPKIEQRFALARAKAQAQTAESAPPPVEKPEPSPPAPEAIAPPRVEAAPPPPPASRRVGLPPFLLGGGSVVVCAGSVLLGVRAHALAGQASVADLDLVSFDLGQQARGTATAANIGYAVAAALLLAAAVALIVEIL